MNIFSRQIETIVYKYMINTNPCTLQLSHKWWKFIKSFIRSLNMKQVVQVCSSYSFDVIYQLFYLVQEQCSAPQSLGLLVQTSKQSDLYISFFLGCSLYRIQVHSMLVSLLKSYWCSQTFTQNSLACKQDKFFVLFIVVFLATNLLVGCLMRVIQCYCISGLNQRQCQM